MRRSGDGTLLREISLSTSLCKIFPLFISHQIFTTGFKIDFDSLTSYIIHNYRSIFYLYFINIISLGLQ